MTAAPGQPDEIPEAFARYQLATFPADLGDFARNETAMRWKHLTGPAEREFWRSLDAAQEPDPAGESSPLGLKLAVTSNRLGHALAALRELREATFDGTPAGDIVRSALAGDTAIRDNTALTREPQPAPCDLPVTTPAVTRPSYGDVIVLAVGEDFPAERAQELQDMLAALNQGVTVTSVRGVDALRAWQPHETAPPHAPELAALVDRLWAAYVRWGRHAGEQKRLAEQALSDPVPERRNVAREGHQAKAGVYQAVAAEISDLIGEAK